MLKLKIQFVISNKITDEYLNNSNMYFIVTYSELQMSIQDSGVAHPTSFGYSIRDAIPGNTMSHNGKSFK